MYFLSSGVKGLTVLPLVSPLPRLRHILPPPPPPQKKKKKTTTNKLMGAHFSNRDQSHLSDVLYIPENHGYRDNDNE